MSNETNDIGWGDDTPATDDTPSDIPARRRLKEMSARSGRRRLPPPARGAR